LTLELAAPHTRRSWARVQDSRNGNPLEGDRSRGERI
jgi:hypothetical protein